MTERLYYADSFLVDFTSRIVDIKPTQDGTVIELAATAFYPTSGGQPHDVGRIGPHIVANVFEENGRVLHLVEGAADLKTDQQVECSVGWSRRFDHMQQHSGQHILSQAALRLLDAPTEGFHLSSRSLTVDLALESIGYEAVAALEDLANRIVWEDRPVSVTFTEGGFDSGTRSRASLDAISRLRVVEIEGFDRSACGGTHVSRTGQIGLIKILRWEKVRHHTRLHFVCGQRAHADYQGRHHVTRELVGALGVQEPDLAAAASSLLQKSRAAQQEVQKLRAELIRFQAQGWLQQARTVSVRGQPAKLATAEVPLMEGMKPKQVAGSVIEAGADIAIIGCHGATPAAVIMCRPDVLADCGQAVRDVCSQLHLKGGGSRNFAQVGGFEAERMPEVIAALAEKIVP